MAVEASYSFSVVVLLTLCLPFGQAVADEITSSGIISHIFTAVHYYIPLCIHVAMCEASEC